MEYTKKEVSEIERLKAKRVKLEKEVDRYNYRVSKLNHIDNKPSYIKIV